MSEVFCNQCGHKNPPGARFCSSCGATLDEPGNEEPTTTSVPVVSGAETVEDEIVVTEEELPEGAAMLIVQRGPNAGSKFFLDADVTRAGRHPDSEIFLDDITVSRRHAEFARSAEAIGGFAVRDAGSLNGTYLNRERIDSAPLVNGDEVQIGKYKMVFLAHHPSEG